MRHNIDFHDKSLGLVAFHRQLPLTKTHMASARTESIIEFIQRFTGLLGKLFYPKTLCIDMNRTTDLQKLKFPCSHFFSVARPRTGSPAGKLGCDPEERRSIAGSSVCAKGPTT
jgi:hypothetical protein